MKDYNANNCDDQEPVFSSVGVGPAGDSFEVELIESENRDATYLKGIKKFSDKSKHDEELWTSGNINGGRLSCSLTDVPDPDNPAFILNFVYTRPDNDGWTITSPTIPYIKQAKPDPVSQCRSVYLRMPGQTAWQDVLVYPPGTGPADYNAPAQGEPWSVNIDLKDFQVSVEIPDGSITTAKLADGAVTNQKLGVASVDTNNLMYRSIVNEKLDLNCVSTNNIQDLSVTTAKLASLSVSLNKLTDDARAAISRRAWPVGSSAGVYGVVCGVCDRETWMPVGPLSPSLSYDVVIFTTQAGIGDTVSQKPGGFLYVNPSLISCSVEMTQEKARLSYYRNSYTTGDIYNKLKIDIEFPATTAGIRAYCANGATRWAVLGAIHKRVTLVENNTYWTGWSARGGAGTGAISTTNIAVPSLNVSTQSGYFATLGYIPNSMVSIDILNGVPRPNGGTAEENMLYDAFLDKGYWLIVAGIRTYDIQGANTTAPASTMMNIKMSGTLGWRQINPSDIPPNA